MLDLIQRSALGSISTPRIFTSPEMTVTEEVFLAVTKVVVRNDIAAQIDLIEGILGLRPPMEPNIFVGDNDFCCSWIAPREWLVIGAAQKVDPATHALQQALHLKSGLAVSITDGRCAVNISGPAARMRLQFLCPIDMHAHIFRRGMTVRTLLGDADCFVQQLDNRPGFRVIVDQTHAEYCWRIIAVRE